MTTIYSFIISNIFFKTFIIFNKTFLSKISYYKGLNIFYIYMNHIYFKLNCSFISLNSFNASSFSSSLSLILFKYLLLTANTFLNTSISF